ncbi:MAG TPA: HsmA family protein [Clostridia bacterium]|nr:HsmA family protein [Clostridia bacterium]
MLLLFAIIFITLALAFYSMGVFGEKFSGSLKSWHVVIFWFGLICDTTGTMLMSRLAGDVLTLGFHSLTGLAAIALMGIHTVWATVVLLQGSETSRQNFHKFSIFVWLIWLIPYVSGMIFGAAVQ